MAEKFLKNSAKKFNPLELRKLMQEQSMKSQKNKAVVEKIDSPLAKYDKLGNLSCIICKTQVKPNVWKVHINSKQHKQKSEASKAFVGKALSQNAGCAKMPGSTLATTANASVVKKASEEVKSVTAKSESQKEGIKSIAPVNEVKNALAANNAVNPSQKPVDPSSLENILPEKFFDEPKETKASENEAFENEWNRFQKEIKEQTSVSYQIEAGQQENAAIEREIEEIDDQLKRWEKVVEFESKTAEVLHKRANKKALENDVMEEDTDDEEVPNALLDLSHWRSKKI